MSNSSRISRPLASRADVPASLSFLPGVSPLPQALRALPGIAPLKWGRSIPGNRRPVIAEPRDDAMQCLAENTRCPGVVEDDPLATFHKLYAPFAQALRRVQEKKIGVPISSIVATDERNFPKAKWQDLLASAPSMDYVRDRVHESLSGLNPLAKYGEATAIVRHLSRYVAANLATMPLQKGLLEALEGPRQVWQLLRDDADCLSEVVEALRASTPQEASHLLAQLYLNDNRMMSLPNRDHVGDDNGDQLKESLSQVLEQRLNETDALRKRLQTGAHKLPLFELAPSLTRAQLRTATVGLPGASYPFAGTVPSNAAQQAVLNEIARVNGDANPGAIAVGGELLSLVLAGTGVIAVAPVALGALAAMPTVLPELDVANQQAVLADAAVVDRSTAMEAYLKAAKDLLAGMAASRVDGGLQHIPSVEAMIQNVMRHLPQWAAPGRAQQPLSLESVRLSGMRQLNGKSAFHGKGSTKTATPSSVHTRIGAGLLHKSGVDILSEMRRVVDHAVASDAAVQHAATQAIATLWGPHIAGLVAKGQLHGVVRDFVGAGAKVNLWKGVHNLARRVAGALL